MGFTTKDKSLSIVADVYNIAANGDRKVYVDSALTGDTIVTITKPVTTGGVAEISNDLIEHNFDFTTSHFDGSPNTVITNLGSNTYNLLMPNAAGTYIYPFARTPMQGTYRTKFSMRKSPSTAQAGEIRLWVVAQIGGESVDIVRTTPTDDWTDYEVDTHIEDINELFISFNDLGGVEVEIKDFHFGRLIEPEYPEVEVVIPHDFSKLLIVDTEEDVGSKNVKFNIRNAGGTGNTNAVTYVGDGRRVTLMPIPTGGFAVHPDGEHLVPITQATQTIDRGKLSALDLKDFAQAMANHTQVTDPNQRAEIAGLTYEGAGIESAFVLNSATDVNNQYTAMYTIGNGLRLFNMTGITDGTHIRVIFTLDDPTQVIQEFLTVLKDDTDDLNLGTNDHIQHQFGPPNLAGYIKATYQLDLFFKDLGDGTFRVYPNVSFIDIISDINPTAVERNPVGGGTQSGFINVGNEIHVGIACWSDTNVPQAISISNFSVIEIR